MLAPDRYLGSDNKLLRERYVEVCCQLAGLYIQQHDTIIAERKARHDAFWSSPESTVAARNREAESASLTAWIAAEDTKMQVAQYQEERDMLVRLLWGDNA